MTIPTIQSVLSPVLPKDNAAPVAPSPKPKTMGGFSNTLDRVLEDKYNMFQKLLLASVKHQSIDNPMSTHEMTQSFTSFFQAMAQSQTNKLLKQGNDLKMNEQVSTARGYLNKEIQYYGDVIGYDGGSQKIQIQIPENLQKVSLGIFDVNTGQQVKEINVDPKSGKKTIEWSGESDLDSNKKVASGQYQILVMGVDKDNGKIQIPTLLSGQVKQISYDEDSGEFLLGINNDVDISMQDVISERKLESSDFSMLTKKLDEQILQYSQLNKLLRQKFELGGIEEKSVDVINDMPELIPVNQQSEIPVQNSVQAS